MLGTLQAWVAWIGSLYAQYPDATSMLTGDMAAGLIMAGADAWFYPDEWPIKQQQQVSMLGVTALGTLFSSAMWVYVDGADAKWFVGACSLMAAAAATPLYFVGSKLLSLLRPNMNLSFGLSRNRK